MRQEKDEEGRCGLPWNNGSRNIGGECETHIDERLPVAEYLRNVIVTVDGKAWLITCFGSLLCIMDILFSINIVPIRNANDHSKAIVLLLFSPLFIFLIMIRFRQFLFASSHAAAWFRAIVYLIVFIAINF